MGNNKGVYCYIKPICFEEDVTINEETKEKGGFTSVIKHINASKNLVLINTNGEMHLGYMLDPEDQENNLFGNVFPFIFIHDEKNQKFFDSVTNTPYSYRTYDNTLLNRVFREDQGELGDYISEAKKASVELLNMNVPEYISNIAGANIKAYKNALLELEKVIQEGYKTFYKDYRSQERNRNR